MGRQLPLQVPIPWAPESFTTRDADPRQIALPIVELIFLSFDPRSPPHDCGTTGVSRRARLPKYSPELREDRHATDSEALASHRHIFAIEQQRIPIRVRGNAVYFNKLGIALHQQAALTLTLRNYEHATKLDPTYADAENNIGTIWYQRKKYNKAIKA